LGCRETRRVDVNDVPFAVSGIPPIIQPLIRKRHVVLSAGRSGRKSVPGYSVPYSAQNIHLGQNLYLGAEAVTVGNAAGQPAKTAVTEFDYDANGNPGWKKDYDWVGFNGAYFESTGTLKRQTTNNYYLSVTDYQSADGYWQPHDTNIWAAVSARRLNAVQRSTISNGSTPYAATEFVYAGNNDSAYTSGNIVYEKRWDSVKSSSLPSLGALTSSNSQVLTRAFDSYGNVTDTYEPEVPTHNTYDSTGSLIVNISKAGQRHVQNTWVNNVAIQSTTDVENSLTNDGVGPK